MNNRQKSGFCGHCGNKNESDGIPELVYAINNSNMGGSFPDRGWYEYVISHYYDRTVTQFIIEAMRDDGMGPVGDRREIIAISVNGTSYFVTSLDDGWSYAVEHWFTIRDAQLVNELELTISSFNFSDSSEIIEELSQQKSNKN